MHSNSAVAFSCYTLASDNNDDDCLIFFTFVCFGSALNSTTSAVWFWWSSSIRRQSCFAPTARLSTFFVCHNICPRSWFFLCHSSCQQSGFFLCHSSCSGFFVCHSSFSRFFVCHSSGFFVCPPWGSGSSSILATPLLAATDSRGATFSTSSFSLLLQLFELSCFFFGT